MNGGPSAIMLKNKERKDEQEIIYLFNQFGKLMNTIDLKQEIRDTKLKSNDDDDYHYNWIGFYFTKEEDLFLVSDNGTIVFLDAYSGKVVNTQTL